MNEIDVKKLSIKLQGCSLYMARDNVKDVIIKLEEKEVNILLRLIKEWLVQ